MKYVRVSSIPPENIEAPTRLFKEWMKAGAPTPGVKILGRWHDAVGGTYEVLEADDHVALSRYLDRWSRICTAKVVPVVDDQELVKALGG